MKTTNGISDAHRLAIIGEYLDGASKASLRRKYNIRSGHTILKWMRIFGIEDPHPRQIEPMKRIKVDESAELARLREELSRTKLALEHERMRADFHETMVEVAEEMFNIPIRKKVGTKP